MKKRILMAVVLVATAILIYAYSNNGYGSPAGNTENVPPDWVEWNEKEINTDVSGMDQLCLSEHKLYAKNKNEVVWTCEPFYEVSDFLWCDIDRDQENELLMLLWKTGEGSRTTEENGIYRQHLYIYEWNPDSSSMEQRWMASNLGMDVGEMKYDAASQNLWLKTTDGKRTCWTWKDWGLEFEDTDIHLVAVGDNLMHKALYRRGVESGSFDFIYSHIKSKISSADIAFVNQETPLVTDPALYSSYPVFGTPCEVAYSLSYAGFDVASCATNHMLDQGLAGVECTQEYLEKTGIKTVGIMGNNPVICNVNNARIAIFNYTESTNGNPLPEESPDAVSLLGDEASIEKELSQAREENDIVIVCVHWGTEYSAEVDETQKKYTDIFLQAGVDLVLGSHPHVISEYELLTSESGHPMLVYYSLGNLTTGHNELSSVIGGMADVVFTNTEDGYEISQYTLEKTIMHQSAESFTVYFEDDYPEILAKQHLVPEVLEYVSD